MRARAVRETIAGIYENRIQSIGANHNDDVLNAVITHTHSSNTRQQHLAEVYLALIYAVVEKWRKWNFSDKNVDELLQNKHAEQLEQFRHAVFHAARFDDRGFQGVIPWIGWAVELDESLGHALQRKQLDPRSRNSSSKPTDP